MKRAFNILISFLAPFTMAASEPGYEVVDILTGSSPMHSRSTDWKPSSGLPLEVGGMDWTADGKLAVAIRKGEVWLLDGVLENFPTNVTYSLFASGLHEPLGVTTDGNSLLVSQRTEITRLRDTDDDGVADQYLTAGHGWNVSGAYHGYAYGPQRDGRGRMWVSLNLDMGPHTDNTRGWRGWAGILGDDGQFVPMAAGMRSPCGLGTNLDGEVFCVDQQGTWIPTTPIYHLKPGAFYLNQEGIGSQTVPGSPLKLPASLPKNMPYPEALEALPQMQAPAVWLPYNKVGRSGTDLALCDANGKFGPFDGQLFVGEFTDAKISRVFLEKVNGEYQGAAFPFVDGLASGVVRISFGPGGSLFVGMSQRGWSSLGSKAYGLQRIRWNGETPFAIQEMRAKPDGFQLRFTSPVDPVSARNIGSYSMKNYTYTYSSSYGSPEIDIQPNELQSAEISNDGLTVRLRFSDLRQFYVHELRAEGIRSIDGSSLVHPDAYYTLNNIPVE